MRGIEPETLSAKDSVNRWTMLVEDSPMPDVYYLPEYARATAEIEQTEPLALIAGTASYRMLVPLLLRHMSATINGSQIEWLDASTPYGYGGLLSLSRPDIFHPEHFRRFMDQLHAWCLDHRVVCCVLRLHPLIQQQDWIVPEDRWENSLQLYSRGTTSSIELSQWNEKLDQPAGLRRDRRADMRLADRVLCVTWNTGDDDDAARKLDIFSGLYRGLVNRNAAESFYRFPQRYFTQLLTLRSRLGIALAWYGDEPVGGNLFLIGPRYAHGHLAATNDIGRKYGASTLLIVEGARQARRRGCELLHIGGGMRPGDSLEEFKRSFGGPSHVYRYITFIADHNMFDKICKSPTAPWPYSLRDATPEPEYGTVTRL